MLSLRNAADADFGEIQRIYEYAQDYMIRSGNPTQWGRSYPSADLIRSDLQKADIGGNAFAMIGGAPRIAYHWTAQ